MNCFVAIILLLQIAQPSAVTAVPPSPGVYYRQDGNNWITLQKANFSDTKATGLELFIETGGWSDLGMEAACPGANAIARISSARPVFYVRETVRPEEVMLIQLTRKKNSRVFHKSTANVTVDNTEGFPKAEIRKTVVANHSSGIYSVTPEVDLKPGEYLLVLGNTTLSFDFGIDKK